MCVYKHEPGVQCDHGPEANIGKVSSVASRMWKSLPKDRRMVNTNHTHERELGKVKSYGQRPPFSFSNKAYKLI